MERQPTNKMERKPIYRIQMQLTDRMEKTSTNGKEVHQQTDRMKRKPTHLWYKSRVPGGYKMNKKLSSRKSGPEDDPESMSKDSSLRTS